MTDWTRLPGHLDPRTFASCRVALHHAVQAVAAAGHSLLPPADDWSHTALFWRSDRGGFVGQQLPSGHRVFLDAGDFNLAVLDRRGGVVAETTTVGSSVAQALEWLGGALVDCGAMSEDAVLSAPDHDLPPLPGGVVPPVDAERCIELGRWYSLATAILDPIRRAQPGASDVLVWPHHFDIATLIAIDPDPHADGARSVGVGLSPGDGTVAGPYFYVTPYPVPAEPPLPELSDLTLYRETWTGYLLPATRAAGWPANDRQPRLERAIRRAIELCLARLRPAP